MFAPLRHSLARLSRWPRRIAALSCLLLAALSALTAPADGRATTSGPRTIAASLRPGEVAITVVVASARALRYVEPGDRIGVLAGAGDAGSPATPRLLADGLRVLAVSAADDETTDAPTVLVAVGRQAALRIASTSGAAALVVVDRSP